MIKRKLKLHERQAIALKKISKGIEVTNQELDDLNKHPDINLIRDGNIFTKTNRKTQISADDVENWRVPKGTVIVCPNFRCRRVISTTLSDIRHNDKLVYTQFEGLVRGAEMKCGDCGMPWFLTEVGRFSTAQGWMPMPYYRKNRKPNQWGLVH